MGLKCRFLIEFIIRYRCFLVTHPSCMKIVYLLNNFQNVKINLPDPEFPLCKNLETTPHFHNLVLTGAELEIVNLCFGGFSCSFARHSFSLNPISQGLGLGLRKVSQSQDEVKIRENFSPQPLSGQTTTHHTTIPTHRTSKTRSYRRSGLG